MPASRNASVLMRSGMLMCPNWCRGVCRDGPVAGTVVYAVNRQGSRVVIAQPPPVGTVTECEMTQLATDASLAGLRLCTL